jgi:hypothetical protein
VRVNPDDRVVIDEVPIGGHVRPSIRSVVASCQTTVWNVVAEFLRLRGNSNPIVVVRRAFCSWVAQDRRHTPLFLLLSRMLKIVVVRHCERRCSEQELHAHRELLVVDSRRHEFIRMNLSASPPTWRASVDVWSSDTWSRIGGNTCQRDQSHVNTRHEILDWFRPSRRVIVLRPVLMYSAIEIGSSIFLLGSFGVFSGFSGWPRYRSILSIYSRRITSQSLAGFWL